MTNFGTQDAPLRASALPSLLECPLSVVLKMQAARDDGNEWAQLGTLIHYGAEALHKTGSEAVALAAMQHKKGSLPLADHGKAEECFRHYAKRSAEWGTVSHVEQKVEIRIPPCPTDPTKAAIVIQGTCDHVRRNTSGYVVCDIKTGTRYSGQELLRHHKAQLAAYQLGISNMLGGIDVGAAVIATRDFKYGGPIYHVAKWSMDDARSIMQQIAAIVAQVRAGNTSYTAGSHCRFCPATRADCEHGAKQYTQYITQTVESVFM